MEPVIERIEAEHRNMAKVLKVLEQLVERAQDKPRKDDVDRLFDICHYLRVFPDAIHHPKEDHHIFDPLRTEVPEHYELLAKVQSQHQACARHTERLYETLKGYADGHVSADALREVAGDYLKFQFEHMRLEESEVLPLAARFLDKTSLSSATRAFAAHGDPLFGENLEAGFNALYQRIVA